MHRLTPPPPPPHGLGAGGSEPARAPRPVLGRGVEIWLVRHGAVAEDRADAAYGNADVPLSPQGEAQSTAVGASFRRTSIARVVSSPLMRARRMGEAIADATQAELHTEEGLIEVNRGDWQDLPRLELQERWNEASEEYWADPANFRGHGGETELELAERTWQALEKASAPAAEGSTIVLTTHHNVMRSILASALGIPFAASFALRQDLARASLLVERGDQWALAACNLERH